jgi:hypothetical protein
MRYRVRGNGRLNKVRSGLASVNEETNFGISRKETEEPDDLGANFVCLEKTVIVAEDEPTQ